MPLALWKGRAADAFCRAVRFACSGHGRATVPSRIRTSGQAPWGLCDAFFLCSRQRRQDVRLPVAVASYRHLLQREQRPSYFLTVNQGRDEGFW